MHSWNLGGKGLRPLNLSPRIVKNTDTYRLKYHTYYKITIFLSYTEQKIQQ